MACCILGSYTTNISSSIETDYFHAVLLSYHTLKNRDGNVGCLVRSPGCQHAVMTMVVAHQLLSEAITCFLSPRKCNYS